MCCCILKREEKRTGLTRLTPPVADRERNAEQERRKRREGGELTAPRDNTEIHTFLTASLKVASLAFRQKCSDLYTRGAW